jgi:hypothetical protein
LQNLSSQFAPVRSEQKQTDREADQAKPDQTCDIFHDLELDAPDDEPDCDRRKRHPQQVIDAADQLQSQGNTTNLRSEGHQVDQERGAEIHDREPRAEPLPD